MEFKDVKKEFEPKEVVDISDIYNILDNRIDELEDKLRSDLRGKLKLLLRKEVDEMYYEEGITSNTIINCINNSIRSLEDAISNEIVYDTVKLDTNNHISNKKRRISLTGTVSILTLILLIFNTIRSLFKK